jgi:hypothetical protein
MDAVFQINEADHGCDSLEAYCRGGQLTIEIEEPWAGSTETGFGQTCSIGLDLDGAEAFARWILATVEAERAALAEPPASR